LYIVGSMAFIYKNMEWKFESGIVGVRANLYGAVVQRVYFVRYSSNSNVRRIITAAFYYSKMSSTDKDKLIFAMTQDNDQTKDSLSSFAGVFIPSMSNVVGIMDFDIMEKNQQPNPHPNFEGTFHDVTNYSQDENDFLTLRHFETNLVKCKYDKCVCTLTNDEEAERRIKEITGCPLKQTTATQQRSDPLDENSCEHPELLKALKKVFELEALVIQQHHTITDLKSRLS
jgi:hypothetical protein